MLNIKKRNMRDFPVDQELTAGDKILIMDAETNTAKWIRVENFVGKEGKSITKMEQLYVTNDIATIRNYMSDGSYVDWEMPVIQGETGLGFADIKVEEHKDRAEILVEKTDGKIEKIIVKYIVGPKGEKGEQGEPGLKGDPFRYSDFTPAQIEALRGPEGRPGRDGTGSGDMSKADYDKDDDGKVDVAKNAEQLDGKNADEYVEKINVFGADGKFLPAKMPDSIQDSIQNHIVKRKILPTEDLNNIQEPGFYWNTFNVESARIGNVPQPFAFSMIVNTSAYGAIQEWTEHTTNSRYIRRGSRDNWTEWKKVPINDSALVHGTGNETITGKKTFNNGIVVPINGNSWENMIVLGNGEGNNGLGYIVTDGQGMKIRTMVGDGLFLRDKDNRTIIHFNTTGTPTMGMPQTNSASALVRKDYVDGNFVNNNIIGAWQDWTPTIVSGGTTGNITNIHHARYKVIGKTCFFSMRVDINITSYAWWLALRCPVPSKSWMCCNASSTDILINSRIFGSCNGTAIGCDFIDNSGLPTGNKTFMFSGSFETN